jgi:hypothetical protein
MGDIEALLNQKKTVPRNAIAISKWMM